MDKRLLTVVKKELRRVFTDRRLVFSTMVLPALSIFLMYSLMGNMISTKVDDISTNVPSAVVIDAPDSFISYSKENNIEDSFEIEYISDTENIGMYKDNILNGELELLVIFDENFDSSVSEYVNPNVTRYYNRSEEYSAEAKWNIDNVLNDYESFLLGERIGNQEHVNVFDLNRGIEKDSIEDEQRATGKGMSTLFPMLIAIFLFAGAMSVGADIIAGEKERGTMATLLVTPVKRETLALGKIIALAIIAIVSASSSFLGIIASLPSAGKMFASDGMDISALKFGSSEYLSLAAIMLTLVGLYVAVVCVVSVISNSVKEANTYMAPIYMVVMIAGFSTIFADGAVETWRFLIPIYGSIIALKNLFAFELTSTMVLYTCASSIIVTSGAIYLIKILFNSERVMFSK